jgi:hypothetical protein
MGNNVSRKVRYHDCVPVAPQMDSMLRLSQQGYVPAPKGMVCHHCQRAGFVWVKVLPHRGKEQYYCGACESLRTVSV